MKFVSIKMLVISTFLIVFMLEVKGQIKTKKESRKLRENKGSEKNTNLDKKGKKTSTEKPAVNNRLQVTEKPAVNNRQQASKGGCEEIVLPMCRGMVPYTHTKLPNQFNHTTQLEVYRHIEHLWAYMDHSCSRNLRLMACSMYLPKCQGKQSALGPCKATCVKAKKKCVQPLKEYMALDWDSKFDCAKLPNKRCLKAVKDDECVQDYPNCVPNAAIKACNGLGVTYGTLPNMFGQCRIDEINTEISHFDKLAATNCHTGLRFLLCGIYSPFCIRPDAPFTFPCKEICEEVRRACEPHYKRLYQNLPWPNKLQCHRYPSGGRPDNECVMPNDLISTSKSDDVIQ